MTAADPSHLQLRVATLERAVIEAWGHLSRVDLLLPTEEEFADGRKRAADILLAAVSGDRAPAFQSTEEETKP